MMELTKEFMQDIIKGRGFGVAPSAVEEMARHLLAGLEQEPVAYMYKDRLHTDARFSLHTRFGNWSQEDINEYKITEIPLYAAPQLPQPSVDELLKEHLRMVECMLVEYREGNSGHAKEWIRHISNSSDKFEEKHSLSPWLWARSHCRTAMLQGKTESAESRCSINQSKTEPVSQPNTLRDGYCIMPMKLTAENGAKGALSGEFSETKFINCPECFGDDECETCDGSGRIEISVPVSWTTIKEIWAKGVEHFAAAPKQEVK